MSNQHCLDTRCFFQGFVDNIFQVERFGTTIGPVGRDHHLAGAVIDPCRKGRGRESREYHRMDGADPGTGQQRHCEVRDHGHVDADAVAFFDAFFLEDIGKTAYAVVQLAVSDVFCWFIRVIGFEDDRVLVTLHPQVPVEAVLCHVQFCALEPFHLRFLKIPFKDLVPPFMPKEMLLGDLFPEVFRLGNGFAVHLEILFKVLDVVVAHTILNLVSKAVPGKSNVERKNPDMVQNMHLKSV